MSANFEQPRIHINRVYTRQGDSGETALVGGQRVRKDDPRIECYGTVDELNSVIGVARITIEALGESAGSLPTILKRIQHELFNAGSLLATLPEDVHPRQPRITAREVQNLEAEIDLMNKDLPALRSFVLPGASRADAELHVCRTVCRRAERLCIALPGYDPETLRYLNRLSDALFVWSRWVNHQMSIEETLWQPNQSSD